MTDVLCDNERFLKILSYYLNAEDTLVKKEAYESVLSCGVDEGTAFSMLLAESLGVDVEREREFFSRYFLPSVKLLSVADYYSDDYFKTVAFGGAGYGDVELKYLSYKPFQGFVRDDFRYYPDGRVVPLIGFFDEEYRYPAVLKGGLEWMTLLPNEINSQKRYIREAFGNVLTYGLGLGYYAFHVAKKAEVESVTVVDVDEDVIRLFNEKIFPCFPGSVKNKIKIVRSDAFFFAENLKDGQFDYIYADIWRDAGDGTELYKKFKEHEKFSPSSKFGYWIEDTIKYYL